MFTTECWMILKFEILKFFDLFLKIYGVIYSFYILSGTSHVEGSEYIRPTLRTVYRSILFLMQCMIATEAEMFQRMLLDIPSRRKMFETSVFTMQILIVMYYFMNTENTDKQLHKGCRYN